jgi:hypothetical protein
MIRIAFLLLLLAPSLAGRAWAADCAAAPPVLELRPPEAAPVIEHTVTPAAIEQLSGAPAPHALMAMGYALDSQIAVRRDDNGTPACAAPSSVIIRFGIVRRDLYLIAAAADDPCIHAALRAHEAAHSHIIAAGAARFLAQHRAALAATLDRLWSTSPNAARLEAGLFDELRRLTVDFGAEMRGPLRAEGDNPVALAHLADACHGAVGELDQAIRAHGTLL